MAVKTEANPCVLIVDDEDDILDLLTYNFEQAGMRTLTARDGIEALETARAEAIDLVVLDIMMPRMDGWETCRVMRGDAKLRHTPILILTAKSEEEDHIRGLDMGADSYLPKTSKIGVVLSQARALLRGLRRTESTSAPLSVHDLEIDRDRFTVMRKRDGVQSELRFPRMEFELLYFLAKSPGRVHSRKNLLTCLWGTSVLVTSRTVDVHVRKIREKLGYHYIETVKGVGYRFAAKA